MGAVYKARHILLGDQVAIKVLPREMRNNAEWLRRFRREGQAARRFRHPNSVTVYDLRTTPDGMIYMVMEYVEGHTLDAELKRHGRFSPAEAFSILEPIISVLGAAHSVGVVHRDLKPENIMIGKAGESGERMTKLLDLGIAKMREMAGSETSATALTVAGQILGTPYYLSPEQWGEMSRDGNPEIDGRADIYSLGAVFYEIVSGRRPFEATTLQEIRRVHVVVPPPALSSAAPAVPQAFSNAIARAMAKDRADRPATMEKFGNELRAALGLPLVQKQPVAQVLPESQPDLDLRNAATITSSDLQGRGRETKSDVAAPTMLTSDSLIDTESTVVKEALPAATQPSINTSPVPADTPSKPVASPAGPYVAPPLEPQAGRAASVQQQQPFHPQSTPAAPISGQKKSSVLIPIIAVILLLVLGAAGVGAWFLLSGSKPETAAKNDAKPANGEPASGAELSVGSSELIRYWVQPAGAKGYSNDTRLAGDFTLHSGDQFRFHFVPERDGYIYIFGDNRGVPFAFLTDAPAEKLNGLKTNKVAKGEELVFPGVGEIKLDKNPGIETYTLIFSPTQLTDVSFGKAVLANELTGANAEEFRAFVSRYSANRPEIIVNNKDQNAPYVSVSTKEAAGSDPLVVEIKFNHK
jgi:serine/threonine-protein kinase